MICAFAFETHWWHFIGDIVDPRPLRVDWRSAWRPPHPRASGNPPHPLHPRLRPDADRLQRDDGHHHRPHCLAAVGEASAQPHLPRHAAHLGLILSNIRRNDESSKKLNRLTFENSFHQFSNSQAFWNNRQNIWMPEWTAGLLVRLHVAGVDGPERNRLRPVGLDDDGDGQAGAGCHCPLPRCLNSLHPGVNFNHLYCNLIKKLGRFEWK